MKKKDEYKLTNYQISAIAMNGLLFIISVAMICSKTVVDKLDYVFWLCLALTSFILVCDTLRKNVKKRSQINKQKISYRPTTNKKIKRKKIIPNKKRP